MEAVMSSCAFNVLSESCRAAPRAVLGATGRIVRMPRREIGGFLALPRKKFRSLPLTCLLDQAVAMTVTKEIDAPDALRTVHVKFKLEKACLFGEHFFVVGDDPMFGLWDPENAIRLNWAEDHIWTANLDIPVGKAIQFKFILKGPGGEVKWQPGPDRTLEPWETNNTIVVSEHWDNPELQKIMEEEASSNQITEILSSLTSQLVIEEIITGEDGNEATNSSPVSQKHEENSIINNEDLPVLVPGLNPASILQFETEEVSPQASMNKAIADASAAIEEANDDRAPENENQAFKNEEPVAFDSSHEAKLNAHDHGSPDELAANTVLDAKPQSTQQDQQVAEVDVVPNDFEWGKMLQKFLLNLGLQKWQLS